MWAWGGEGPVRRMVRGVRHHCHLVVLVVDLLIMVGGVVKGDQRRRFCPRQIQIRVLMG